MRPLISGWFGEWSNLTNADPYGLTVYENGSYRFAGSTYDPTSHYRAAAVFSFFKDENLTPTFLRSISQSQIKLLINNFDDIDAHPKIICRNYDIPIKNIGGFLVLNSPKASEISLLLRERGVLTDYRNNNLRLGPAPYISNNQIYDSIEILKEIINSHQNVWLKEIET